MADHVQVGISTDDVRTVATGIFWQNFPQLRDAASAEVQRRLGHSIALIEQQFSDPLTPDQVSELSEPDAQVALLDVLRSSVRTKDEDLRLLLAGLLAGRLKSSAKELRKILYNEAIVVAPKLTANQLKVIGTIVLVRNIQNATVGSWEEYDVSVGKCLAKFVGTEPHVHDLEHLQYLGCLAFEQPLTTLADDLADRFPRLFQKGVTAEEIAGTGLPDEMRDELFAPVGDAKQEWLMRVRRRDLDALIREESSSEIKEVLTRVKKLYRAKEYKEIYQECKLHPALGKFLQSESTEWIWNSRLTPLGMVLAVSFIEQIDGQHITLDGFFGDDRLDVDAISTPCQQDG